MRKVTATIIGATMAAALALPASAQTQGVTDDEIVMGTHTALTGPVAVWGVPSTNAIRMRFDEANEAGGIHGRQIRFIVEDSAYQVPRAVQAANKLLNRDRIFVMVGALGTPMNNAVLPRQLQQNVINFAPFTAARQMSEPFHELKFVGLGTYYAQIRSGIRYLAEQNDRSRICTAYRDSDFGREIQEGAIDQAEKMGMEVVADVPYPNSEQEFTAHVSRLREANCDLVAVGSIVGDAIRIYRTARGMGWNDVDFLTSVASYTIVTGERAGDGLYSGTSFELIYPGAEGNTDRQNEWAAKYEERFGQPHNGAAQLGYIYADVLVEALERAGRDLTTEGLVEALESIKGYETGLGNAPISFGENDHVGADQAFLAVVRDGKWETITDPLSY